MGDYYIPNLLLQRGCAVNLDSLHSTCYTEKGATGINDRDDIHYYVVIWIIPINKNIVSVFNKIKSFWNSYNS